MQRLGVAAGRGSPPAERELRSILDWAAECGLPTPLYLFCPSSVGMAVSQLRSGLRAGISYATKANIHPLMLRTLRDVVDAFNVTNPAHLRLVVEAGVAPERILYINPVFDERIVGEVLSSGVRRFVVDDERGLRLLAASGKAVDVTLRFRPSLDGAVPRSVVRFGAPASEITRLALIARDSRLRVEALSFFIGVHGAREELALPFLGALRELADVYRRVCGIIDIPAINIGGGFPGSRRDIHRRNPHFFATVQAAIDALFPAGVTVLCEPGRFLSEPSMAILARVVSDRRIANRRTTHVDASAYTGLFESTFIQFGGDELTIACGRDGQRSTTQVLGPIMDSFDVIKRDAELPELRHGDLLLIPNIGAYSWGYAATCEGLRRPHVLQLPPELDRPLASLWYA